MIYLLFFLILVVVAGGMVIHFNSKDHAAGLFPKAQSAGTINKPLPLENVPQIVPFPASLAKPVLTPDPRYTPASSLPEGLPANIIATESDVADYNALPDNQKQFLKTHIAAWNSPVGLCPLHNAVVMTQDIYTSNPPGTAGLI